MDGQSTLPRAWVERIFNRLHGIYGSQFSGKYHQGVMVNGVDAGLENAMQVWADELAGFSDHPEAIRYALENLDSKFPPSSKEFIELCRRAPRKQAPMIEHKISPEEIARGLEMLEQTQKKVSKPKQDMLDWARKPRSALAFAYVYQLAIRDEEGEFIGILDDLRNAGHVDGDRLVHRWDYASSGWVLV
ncbi:MAG: hypothetical protein ACR2IJ_08715 [Fluviibacter sp.]